MDECVRSASRLKIGATSRRRPPLRQWSDAISTGSSHLGGRLWRRYIRAPLRSPKFHPASHMGDRPLPDALPPQAACPRCGDAGVWLRVPSREDPVNDVFVCETCGLIWTQPKPPTTEGQPLVRCPFRNAVHTATAGTSNPRKPALRSPEHE
jgi:hypothetical protein